MTTQVKCTVILIMSEHVTCSDVHDTAREHLEGVRTSNLHFIFPFVCICVVKVIQHYILLYLF